MIVQNFGLLWERSMVEWGKPGTAGQLRGYSYPFRSYVDFSQQAGIYLLYEGFDPATHKVVYIGQAGLGKRGGGLYKRLHNHAHDSLWNRWTRFSWFGIYALGKKGSLIHISSDKRVKSSVRDVLNHLEASLLSVLEPPLNSQGARWKGAAQYWQYQGEDYDPGNPFRATPPLSRAGA